jgi:hypothetical protein
MVAAKKLNGNTSENKLARMKTVVAASRISFVIFNEENIAKAIPSKNSGTCPRKMRLRIKSNGTEWGSKRLTVIK